MGFFFGIYFFNSLFKIKQGIDNTNKKVYNLLINFVYNLL